jgi:hypothetical protein
MKDEIKEILDNLKYTAKKHTIQVLENGGKIEHCPQEIETELRLNTYSANILYDYITNLQEENERVSNLYQTYEEANGLWIKKYEDYKSRNEKAIELLKKFYDSGSCPLGNISKAYEILNGGDDNE